MTFTQKPGFYNQLSSNSSSLPFCPSSSALKEEGLQGNSPEVIRSCRECTRPHFPPLAANLATSNTQAHPLLMDAVEIQEGQPNDGKGHLSRACYSKGVGHHHLHYAETQSLAEEWESSTVEKRGGFSTLMGAVGMGN